MKAVPEVAVGMGATMRVGSDCYPYTVIEVKRKGRQIVIQADNFKRIDSNGMSERQEYVCSLDKDGPTLTANWSGKWGRYINGCLTCYVGSRRAYQDPCF